MENLGLLIIKLFIQNLEAMLTKVINVGTSYTTGQSNANISNPEAISFEKAVAGEHKAIPVVDVIIRKEDGKIAICKLSLRQVHSIVTRTDMPQLAGVATLPKTREEDDKEGAKDTAKWLLGAIPKMKMLAAQGKLVAEYALRPVEVTKDGITSEIEYAQLNGIFVSDESIINALAQENTNYAFEALLNDTLASTGFNSV